MQVKEHLDELFSGAARAEFEERLAAYIEPRRWFRSKTRKVTGASLEHVVPLPQGGGVGALGGEVVVAIVRLTYAEGPEDEYVVPLTWVQGDAGAHLAQTRPHLVVGAVTVAGEERPRWLVDALGERRALAALLDVVARGATLPALGTSGTLDKFGTTAASCSLTFRRVGAGVDTADASPRPVETEQSNTSIVYGDSCIVKIVRKLDEGTSPDLEMGEYLTLSGYDHTPRLLGAIELVRPGREAATVGVVHAFVRNEGDAWSFTLGTIARSAERTPSSDAERLASSVAFVGPLAHRVGQMHAALAAATPDARFAPEPIERAEREALGEAVAQSLDAAWALVDRRAASLPADVVTRIGELRARDGAYRACIDRFVGNPHPCVKTRVHGDLHLGQILVAGDDFVLIDFEGEPARPLAARKAKRSPLVDVAGMLRSLHYAAVTAARVVNHPDRPVVAFSGAWHDAARRLFLDSYNQAAAVRSVLPDDVAAREVFLRFYLLEKCVYELHYELDNRPDWVAIPVLGLQSILEDADAG